MNLTLGEQIVLLALDEKSGELTEAELRVSLAVAAAGMLEEGREGASREVLLAAREAALEAAYQGLLGKGIVTEHGRRVLGVFGSVKHPVSDATELVALKGRLDSVLVGGQEPDEATAALVSIVHRSGMKAALPQGDGVDERAAAIAEAQGQAVELGDTIRTTFAALAAVIAATAV